MSLSCWPRRYPLSQPVLRSALMLVMLFSPASAVQAASLSISCGAVGIELSLCQQGVDAWSAKTGHAVKVVPTPNSATERLALYQQILSARSTDIDVFQIDVIWPGTLSAHLVDLRPYVDASLLDPHFPSVVENNTVDGRLVAMPWFTSAGVLFYRKDLLARYDFEPPETWAQLTRIAEHIQRAERAAGQQRMQGFVFQAKGYEGLTCDALEWVHSFGGGTLVDESGAVTINNPRAVAALEMAASWVGRIAPEGVLNYDEEASRGVFQSGNAVFMRNWPYAWALAQAKDSPVRGKVGIAELPRGPEGRSSSTLGGWQLAVSRYSKHPELAADLVRHLTGIAEQKRRAINGTYAPTIAALYEDPDVLAAVPVFGRFYDSFAQAVARPSRIAGPKYSRVSAAFYASVHDVLAGKQPAEQGLRALSRRLERLSRGGRW